MIVAVRLRSDSALAKKPDRITGKTLIVLFGFIGFNGRRVTKDGHDVIISSSPFDCIAVDRLPKYSALARLLLSIRIAALKVR